MADTGIFGLVLTGGQSRRMGQDKALMQWRGLPQWLVSARLLSAACEEVCVSVAKGNPLGLDGSEWLLLEDEYRDAGPLAGMAAAIRWRNNVAWFVLACDLSAMGLAEIRHLATQRRSGFAATAMLDPASGHPEPLVAIYEPETFPQILDVMEARRGQGPSSILKEAGYHGVKPLFDGSLTNSNEPGGWIAPGVKRLSLWHFSVLREKRGLATEEFHTFARNAEELWEEWTLMHRITMHRRQVRVAINDELVDWQTPVTDGDEVVFLPPVSGG